MLQEIVEKNNWDKIRAAWIKIDDTGLEFPVLDEEDLRNIILGVYQLKLAKLYTKEHMQNDGGYDIMVHKQEPGIIMAKIQSRHVSSKIYKMWIEFDEISVNGWYCQCKCGSRVVGSCAHIASVIWYLGFARHKNIQFDPQTDLSLHLRDARDMPEPNVMDEDDENVPQVEE